MTQIKQMDYCNKCEKVDVFLLMTTEEGKNSVTNRGTSSLPASVSLHGDTQTEARIYTSAKCPAEFHVIAAVVR